MTAPNEGAQMLPCDRPVMQAEIETTPGMLSARLKIYRASAETYEPGGLVEQITSTEEDGPAETAEKVSS